MKEKSITEDKLDLILEEVARMLSEDLLKTLSTQEELDEIDVPENLYMDIITSLHRGKLIIHKIHTRKK